MDQADIYILAGMALFAIALHALAARRHLVRKVLAINILGGGCFLVLIAVARRAPGPVADPVPHAMVLTGIVVAVSVTAVALILVRRIRSATGRTDFPEDNRDDRV
ncbi:MAG: Na+/H+ antiporter subunit C [Rhodospirillales bacterium]|nr:MAG: Na+/H+ antiporter subunit C [Rhodospirillales bacterium]